MKCQRIDHQHRRDPENYLGKLIALQPEVAIIVDIADFDAEPGDTALLEIDEIQDGGLTTHNASLVI